MSKKKIAIVAGLLVAAGAAATVAAQGHRRGGMDMMDGHMMGRFGGPGGDGGGRMGHGGRGMFGGSLTADEHEARAREQFARLDKNGDGFIDAGEIEAGLQSRFGDRGPNAGNPGERMLGRFDTNKDGKVTKDEAQAQLRKRFAEMDLNNDGKIDDADLPPMMRGQGVLTGGGTGMGPGMGRGRGGGMGGGFAALRDADANKDGVVTVDEFVTHGMKRFDAMDRNKDGVVDKADFDALKKETAEYRVKRFIHAFGADKEGKISKEQFYAKAKERFAAMDVNGDGKISREDHPGGGRGGMRERMRGWFGGGGDGQTRGPGMGPGMGPGGPGGPGPAPKN